MNVISPCTSRKVHDEFVIVGLSLFFTVFVAPTSIANAEQPAFGTGILSPEQLRKTYREYQDWLAKDQLLDKNRCANVCAIFRARVIAQKSHVATHALELNKVTVTGDDLPVISTENSLGKATSSSAILGVENIVAYLPERIGPSLGFFPIKPPLEAIRYLEVYPNRIARPILRVWPSTEGLKIIGTKDCPFDETVCERLRIVGTKTPTKWPNVDAIVEFDGMEPSPILIEDTKNSFRRAYIVPHFYASISDTLGNVEIQGIEADKKLSFRFFHPILGHDFTGVQIAGEEIGDDGTIELTLASGLNDFGNIDLSPAIKRNFEKLKNKETNR